MRAVSLVLVALLIAAAVAPALSSSGPSCGMPCCRKGSAMSCCPASASCGWSRCPSREAPSLLAAAITPALPGNAAGVPGPAAAGSPAPRPSGALLPGFSRLPDPPPRG